MVKKLLKQVSAVFLGIAVLAGVSTVTAEEINEVDILIVYDADTAQAIQGGAETYINQIVAYTNKAFSSSDMNVRLRLVHSQQLNIAGVSQVSEVGLTTLAQNQQLQQLREQYGADLVSMLAPAAGNWQTGVLCGIAYVGLGERGRFYSYAGQSAYSLVGYNCGAVTFAHEIGHNLGLGHSHLQGDRGGVFAYGLGHGVQFSFSTIMTYAQSYGLRNSLDYFSNPRLNLCEGEPCGVPVGTANAADAAYAVNQVSDQVTQWRATKVVDIPTEEDTTAENGSNEMPGADGDSGNESNGPESDSTDNPITDSNDTDNTDKTNNEDSAADGNDTAAGDDSETVAVQGISLPTELLITNLREFNQLSPTLTPANATNQQIEFVSQDSNIATVSNSGLVYSRRVGETKVTAISVDGQHFAEVTVRVVDAQADQADAQTTQAEDAAPTPTVVGSLPLAFLSLVLLFGVRRVK